MALAIVYSRASAGIQAPLVTVEVHLSRGLPKLNIVGLPEAAVKESKDRVRSALLNTHFEYPRRRLTVNLAPADLPKEGGRFDLPIALGILAASGQIPVERLSQYEFIGELALSGELRQVRGILPVVIATHKAQRTLIIPEMNAEEAGLVEDAEVFSAKHLLEVCAFLQEKQSLKRCTAGVVKKSLDGSFDLADVKGQAHAKRALEIAAAGNHSLLFVGPPGTGKTMLASRLAGILPEMTNEQAIELAAIHSISLRGFDIKTWQVLPFRAPHHTSSSVALVGGGRPPRPGEISLAHHGVLFLDELPEFNRHVLESLREPLESGHITISRAGCQETFPAQFQLIAAMNPCPCGYAGTRTGKCRCTDEQIQRYLGKLSSPLIDRIDMQMEVPSLPPEMLNISSIEEETSESVKARILAARQLEEQRQGKCNQALSVKEIPLFCQLGTEEQILLNQIIKKFNFTARTYHRILRVARTIADLSGSIPILNSHLKEAIGYRYLDKLKINRSG